MTKQKQDNVVFKKKKGFTQVQNYAPDDMQLSDKALGLYTRIQRWITFEAEDFVCSKAFIRTKTPSGDKAFDSAWNELKERGYLKMYCQMFPRATWTAELLDEPQPDTPHTYYVNAQGEVTKTNVEMAEQRENSRTPQKGDNGNSRTPHFGGTGNGSTGNRGTGNGGNNIITPDKTLNNTLDNTNQSIYHSEQLGQESDFAVKENPIDRLIDSNLINEIKEQIDYEALSQSGIFSTGINPEDLDIVVDAIAALKTATKPMQFGDGTYDPDVIRSRADMINSGHIEYVFECFYDHREEVRNVRKYLMAAVFNAPATYGSFYSNRVRAAGMI